MKETWIQASTCPDAQAYTNAVEGTWEFLTPDRGDHVSRRNCCLAHQCDSGALLKAIERRVALLKPSPKPIGGGRPVPSRKNAFAIVSPGGSCAPYSPIGAMHSGVSYSEKILGFDVASRQLSAIRRDREEPPYDRGLIRFCRTKRENPPHVRGGSSGFQLFC